MVVSAAVTQTQLQYRAGDAFDQMRGGVEAGALRHHAPNEAIEPAHVSYRTYQSAISFGQRVAQLVRRAVET